MANLRDDHYVSFTEEEVQLTLHAFELYHPGLYIPYNLYMGSTYLQELATTLGS